MSEKDGPLSGKAWPVVREGRAPCQGRPVPLSGKAGPLVRANRAHCQGRPSPLSSGRQAGQKMKEEEESKCRNAVPRPADRPSGFGETFGKLSGVQKTEKAGRPAGKPRFHRHWLLKLFCIRNPFMRDFVV